MNKSESEILKDLTDSVDDMRARGANVCLELLRQLPVCAPARPLRIRGSPVRGVLLPETQPPYRRKMSSEQGTAESETSRLSVRGKLLGGRRGMGFSRYVGRQNGYVYSPDRL